jgi:hypothetical protein
MPPERRAFPRFAARLAIVAACHAAVLGGPAGAAFAQGGKSVTTTLIQRGSAQFDDQAYEESIQTLSAALVRPGATDKERIEIYRLLANNFITLKRADEADAAVRGIFVLDESFALPPTESPRFRDFFTAAKRKWVEEGKPGKSAGNAPPVEKPIKMAHTSPAQVPASTQIKLTGTIEDPDGRVRGVILAYRTGAKGKFNQVAATYAMGEFRASIPTTAVKPPLIEYYLTGVDKGGLPVTSRGDAATPLRVVVPEERSIASSPALWVPLGLAVVGGAVATAILLSRSKGTSTVTVGVRE